MLGHRKIRTILTFLLIIIQIAIMMGLALKEHYDPITNVAVMASFWIIYTFVEIKYDLYLNNYVRAMAMLTTISDNFMGHYLRLYITSDIFDKVQHVLGSYSLSLFAFFFMINFQKNPISNVFKFTMVLAVGLGLGVVYEIAEFIGDTFTKPVVPGQTSLFDTNLDLISDMIGASVGAIHAVIKDFSKGN